MRGKVRIQEIADFAGVSKFAVSRALSGKSGVSAKTREKILRVAGQLGYFKNNEQQQHFTGELQEFEEVKWDGTIVVMFPNLRYQNKEHIYWGPVFEGVSSRLRQRGLDIITITEPSDDNVFKLLNPAAIQGIITIGTVSTQMLLKIKQMDIPVVMVDHSDPVFACDTIFTDNFNSMQQMMMTLISKGYRKFQFVGNIKDAQSYFDRWLAFRSALENCQIELQQDPMLIGPEAQDIYLLFKQYRPVDLPEVYVCAHDVNAKFLIEQLGYLGIEVPARCAVTGFDNTCDTHPILATVNVNKELLGMRAVDQMLWRIQNPGTAHEKKLIYADVILRENYAYPLSGEAEQEEHEAAEAEAQ
ncbi:transcriptional regulator, LacI family [Paenibacillus sp. UNC496MF]|uniref:LacI family DNA-binding transcriptional regulator n=1 Tax=Paenibacillus sp. UNC496MF TaxID=1502753 RepID=UPI0008F25CB5|nr:LacI family DNA-binding transcriptional regulator [Paenibacillus sp. UNC496MF]SFJ33576.1 transcriptional regulator, LacI family [Paenibacillus sp. UNC496MF]